MDALLEEDEEIDHWIGAFTQNMRFKRFMEGEGELICGLPTLNIELGVF